MNPGLRTNHNYRVATFSIYNYYGFIVGIIFVIVGLRPVIIVMTLGCKCGSTSRRLLVGLLGAKKHMIWTQSSNRAQTGRNPGYGSYKTLG